MIENLKAEMENCQKCDLCLERKTVVFGEGNASEPLIMIVGEAPGADEDEAGRPFVGRCGAKLNEMLTYAGLAREEIYITNSVLCRPPNNRMPVRAEIAACRNRLLRQIQLVKPKIIVTLGRVPAQAMVGKEIPGSLSKLFSTRFHEIRVGELEALCVFSYHPSYLLRSRKVAFPIMLQHWTDIKNKIAELKDGEA
jgi:uracil-DNA glycosylase family 4